MNYVDLMINKVVSWIDQAFSFVSQYSGLFVWGFVAIMVSKMFKLNVRYTKK